MNVCCIHNVNGEQNRRNIRLHLFVGQSKLPQSPCSSICQRTSKYAITQYSLLAQGKSASLSYHIHRLVFV